MLEQKITFDKFIRWTIIVVAILAAIYIIDYLSAVLLPFFVAWGLAYLIFPVVKFVQYKMRVKIRALSIIIAFMFVISVLGGVLWFIIPPTLSQFHQLGEVLNQWIHTTTHTNDLTAAISAWLKEHQREIETYLHSTDFSEALKSTMPKVFQLLGKTASVIFSIVASLISVGLRVSHAKLGEDIPQEEPALLAGTDGRRGTGTEQLHPRAGHRLAHHGRHVLHRLHHHRLPHGPSPWPLAWPSS